MQNKDYEPILEQYKNYTYSKEQFTNALKRLVLSRMRILMKHSFYGLLLMHTKFKVEEECETAYTDGDYVATAKICLNAFKNKDEVWRAIKNVLQEIDAKYPEKVTRDIIRHIISELPLGITKGFVEEDKLAKEFDRVDYNH